MSRSRSRSKEGKEMRKKTLALIPFSLWLVTALGADIPGVSVETRVKTNQTWDGTVLPAYPTNSPEISVLRFNIAPGAQLPPHLHPVINVAYVITGELTVTTDQGLKKQLKAGDAVVELVNQIHYGKNEGTEPVELVVVYAGTNGQKVTVLGEQGSR
jgi:quercetin dioxygenase-like cupin family protein